MKKGCAVEERRQECDEHEVGRELDGRHARNEAKCEAAEHEEDGVRHPDDLRDREERGAGREEPEQDDAVFGAEVHLLISADAAVVRMRRGGPPERAPLFALRRGLDRERAVRRREPEEEEARHRRLAAGEAPDQRLIVLRPPVGGRPLQR